MVSMRCRAQYQNESNDQIGVRSQTKNACRRVLTWPPLTVLQLVYGATSAVSDRAVCRSLVHVDWPAARVDCLRRLSCALRLLLLVLHMALAYNEEVIGPHIQPWLRPPAEPPGPSRLGAHDARRS